MYHTFMNRIENFYKILNVVEYYCECVIDESHQVLRINDDCNRFILNELTSEKLEQIKKNKEKRSQIYETVKILFDRILVSVEKTYGLLDADDMPNHVLQFLVDIKNVCEQSEKINDKEFDNIINELDSILDNYLIDEDSIYA